jgi:hypothetical protein
MQFSPDMRQQKESTFAIVDPTKSKIRGSNDAGPIIALFKSRERAEREAEKHQRVVELRSFRKWRILDHVNALTDIVPQKKEPRPFSPFRV